MCWECSGCGREHAGHLAGVLPCAGGGASSANLQNDKDTISRHSLYSCSGSFYEKEQKLLSVMIRDSRKCNSRSTCPHKHLILPTLYPNLTPLSFVLLPPHTRALPSSHLCLFESEKNYWFDLTMVLLFR